MSILKIIPVPTQKVRAFQSGALDANGSIPERIAEGGGPCRHCLKPIHMSEEKLVLCYRPFDSLQPYAESGPIFLHAKKCSPYDKSNQLPDMLRDWGDALLIARGYTREDRIQYNAAVVIPANQLEKYCCQLLADKLVAYIHIRLGSTNCYQFRVELESHYTA